MKFIVKTLSRKRCEKYCSAIQSCKILAFDKVNHICHLYDEEACTMDEGNGTWTTSYMGCIEEAKNTCIALSDFMKNGGNFKKLYSSECLGVKVSNTSGFKLTWTACGIDTKWTVDLKNHDISQIRKIKHSHTDQCLTTKRENYVYLSIQSCSEPLLTNHLSLISNTLGRLSSSEQKLCDMALLKGTKFINQWPNPNLLLDTKQQFTFHVVSTAKPSEQSCARFQVINGDVVVNGLVTDIPVFLPGEMITVKCKSGFGIKEISYSSEVEIVCGGESWEGRHVKCRRIKSNNDTKDGSAGKKETSREHVAGTSIDSARFIVVVVGLAMIVIFFIFLFVHNLRVVSRDMQMPTQNTRVIEVNNLSGAEISQK